MPCLGRALSESPPRARWAIHKKPLARRVNLRNRQLAQPKTTSAGRKAARSISCSAQPPHRDLSAPSQDCVAMGTDPPWQGYHVFWQHGDYLPRILGQMQRPITRPGHSPKKPHDCPSSFGWNDIARSDTARPRSRGRASERIPTTAGYRRIHRPLWAGRCGRTGRPIRRRSRSTRRHQKARTSCRVASRRSTKKSYGGQQNTSHGCSPASGGWRTGERHPP